VKSRFRVARWWSRDSRPGWHDDSCHCSWWRHVTDRTFSDHDRHR